MDRGFDEVCFRAGDLVAPRLPFLGCATLVAGVRGILTDANGL